MFSLDLLLQAVVSGVLLGGVYGLVASGLSLIFGVLRIINFAHGAVMMLGMYTTYWLFTLLKVDPYLSIVVTGPAFFVLGEALVEVPRLVACGGAIVMALALFAFLRMTDVGKAIRALAEEPEGALLMGIDVGRIRAVAFGIGAGCVAVAGALVTPFFYVAPDVGESFNIMAFVVVVLGGMGNFVGALLGGFIVGLAESLGATLLPGSLKQLVVFALFVLVLLFRPAGLFGGGRGR